MCPKYILNPLALIMVRMPIVLAEKCESNALKFDVKSTFLHCELEEEVYRATPDII